MSMRDELDKKHTASLAQAEVYERVRDDTMDWLQSFLEEYMDSGGGDKGVNIKTAYTLHVADYINAGILMNQIAKKMVEIQDSMGRRQAKDQYTRKFVQVVIPTLTMAKALLELSKVTEEKS